MAEETRTPDYAPIVIGQWTWDEQVGEHGGWKFELTHELLLVGSHDAAVCIVLPPGHVLMYESDGGQPRSMTGAFWHPLPPFAVLADVVGGGEQLDELKQQQQAARDAVLEKIPF